MMGIIEAMTGKFVAYYRVSTTKQGINGLGMDAQRDAVARYLNGGDWKLIGEFAGVESGKRNNRQEMEKAIALCRKEGATLLIAKLDRLARNAAFLLNLRDSGVDFIAVDMPHADKFTVGIMALVAEKEQRYLILGDKVWIFEGVVHEDDQFPHDGGEGDFGGFAGRAQALIERLELAVGARRYQRRHIQRAAHWGAASSDAPAAMPLATLPRMRGQSGQCRRLAAVERAQFGQFGQHPQGRNGADASDGDEFLHPFVQSLGLRLQLPQLRFDLFQIAFQAADETLGLAAQGGHGEPLGLLALRHEEGQYLPPGDGSVRSGGVPAACAERWVGVARPGHRRSGWRHPRDRSWPAGRWPGQSGGRGPGSRR